MCAHRLVRLLSCLVGKISWGSQKVPVIDTNKKSLSVPPMPHRRFMGRSRKEFRKFRFLARDAKIRRYTIACSTRFKVIGLMIDHILRLKLKVRQSPYERVLNLEG